MACDTFLFVERLVRMIGEQVKLNGRMTGKTGAPAFRLAKQILLVRTVWIVAGPAEALFHRRMDNAPKLVFHLPVTL